MRLTDLMKRDQVKQSENITPRLMNKKTLMTLAMMAAWSPLSASAMNQTSIQATPVFRATTPKFVADVSEVNSVDWLVRQLNYAQILNRPDITKPTLERLNAIAPQSAEALFFQASDDINQGKLEDAEQILKQLQQSEPNNPLTLKLVALVGLEGDFKADYQKAQLLARSGRIDEAVKIYHRIFPAGMPTPDLELEYILLKGRAAGSDALDTIEQLRQFNQKYPGIPKYQLAYAEQLTAYNEKDPVGLKMLQQLSLQPGVGNQAANTWLNRLDQIRIDENIAQQYGILASYFPDNEAFQKANAKAKVRLKKEIELRKDPTYLAKLEGLELIEKEQYLAARKPLLIAYGTRPKDPEILSGLGFSYLKTGEQIKALHYFKLTKQYDTNLLNTDKWDSLIAASAYWAQIDEGNILLKQGRYAQAKAKFQASVDLDPDGVYAYNKLAEVALAQGDFKQANYQYHEALKRGPDNETALRGLINVKVQSSGVAGALAYAQTLSLHQQTVLSGVIADLKSEQFIAEMDAAFASQDHDRMAAVIEKALQNPPSSPWDKVQISDALHQLGQGQKADNLMQSWRAGDTSAQMKFAYGLYLSRHNDPDEALTQLRSIPKQERSESMNSNLVRLELAAEQDDLQLLVESNPQQAQQKVDQLKENYADNISLQLTLIGYEYDLGMHDQAIADANALIGKTDSYTDELTLGELLLRLKDEEGFLAWKQQLDEPASASLASQEFATRRDVLFAQYAFEHQDYQQAHDLLVPLTKGSSEQAIDLSFNLLEVNAALGLFDENQLVLDNLYAQTELLSAKQTINLAGGYQQQVNIEGRVSNNVTSKQDRNQQRSIELAQLLLNKKDADGYDYRSGLDIAMQNNEWQLAEDLAYQSLAKQPDISLDEHSQAPAPKLTETSTAEQKTPDNELRNLYDTAPDNWYTRGIKSDIDSMRERDDSYIMFGYDFSGRDSENQTSQIPVEARIAMPQYDGHLLIRADFVSVDSGSLDYYDVDESNPASFSQQSSGVAFGLGWQADNWSFDLGTTPIGFDQSTWVGGLNLDGDLQDFGWKATISRRVETSSTLSYAGMNVPDNAADTEGSQATGDYWGLVTAQGVKLGLSYDQGGSMGYWGSLQYHGLTGENVADNTRLAVLGGAYKKLITEANQNLSIGLNGLYFDYDKNLGEYLYQSGGYYSPQSYFSVSLPVNYYARPNPNLSYRLSASISNSWSKEDAPYLTDESSSRGGGFGYSLEAALEQRISKKWYIGGSLELQRSEFYEPNHLFVYMRYTFDDRWQPVDMPLNPLTLYADFD